MLNNTKPGRFQKTAVTLQRITITNVTPVLRYVDATKRIFRMRRKRAAQHQSPPWIQHRCETRNDFFMALDVLECLTADNLIKFPPNAPQLIEIEFQQLKAFAWYPHRVEKLSGVFYLPLDVRYSEDAIPFAV